MHTIEEYNEALEAYVKMVTDLHEAHYKNHFASLPVPEIKVSHGSKLTKLTEVRYDDSGKIVSKSVRAFVAKSDYDTKGLGEVKEGDILMPASWSAPAKHARGSIFDDDHGRSYADGVGRPMYMR